MAGWSYEFTPPGVVMNGVRSIFSWLDWAVYSIITYIYKVFFYVSTATIFDGAVINAFFSRIQLILGIFMIFKLSISLLNLIVNPDLFKDRNTGTGKIVMRVIVSLLMLTLVVPLNIPGAEPDTYNGFINDNGILFGTLYAVQNRVLEENILAKIVLGVPGGSGGDVPDVSSGVANAGNVLATSMLRGFITINVYDENVTDICGNNTSVDEMNDTNCSNVVCPAEVKNSVYTKENASISDLTDLTSLRCDGKLGTNYGAKYAFAYRGLISTVVGVVIIIILLGFTIDVAIRALKLAVLRLIAPIPIISYVDPKSSKDGAFASWVKTLTSTYLDLFVRLIIIYFVIFVVQELSQHGAVLAPGATGFTKVLTYIFIVIGALFFAKQAPNFIKTMLGSKGVGFGPGVSGALGFMGGVIGGGGLSGALSAGALAANTTNEAQAQGKQAPGGWGVGSDLAAKIRTGDPNAKGGILNTGQRALANLSARRHGYGGALDAKDHWSKVSVSAENDARDLKEVLDNENATLSSLKAQNEAADRTIANARNRRLTEFSEAVRSQIEAGRQNGASQQQIMQDAVNYGWATRDMVDSYFDAINEEATANATKTQLMHDISAQEARVASLSEELTQLQYLKQDADVRKKKAEENIANLTKIHGVTGGRATKGDSKYSAREWYDGKKGPHVHDTINGKDAPQGSGTSAASYRNDKWE